MSSEHTDLADRIKKVHQQLRRDVKQTPEAAEAIWNTHVADTDKLNEYAQSMRELAEQHWAEKPHGHKRVSWCYETIKGYFFGAEASGLHRKRARDQRKQLSAEICPQCEARIQQGIARPRVLDVGSCYNAFSQYADLETIAIDIAPADESVHRIDFLRTPQPPLICTHSFDTIIFSLVLDYLPTCRQRLSACLIAHQLLSCLGLLLIVEPDSSLRGNRYPSWRQALESLGFGLVAYLKVINVHCLAFRKRVAPPAMTEDERERIAELLNIPQDNPPPEVERQLVEVDQDLFDELPLSFD